MPEYLSPGVYVEEVDTGNKPIEGVATSTAGFVGITERGPVAATLVTSFSEFVRTFGRYVKDGASDRYLAYAVEGFFQNGGKRCFIMRVVSGNKNSPALPAKATLDGMTVNANGPGIWASGRLAVKVSKAGVDLVDSTLFRLTVLYWDSSVQFPSDPTDATKKNVIIVDPTDPSIVATADLTDPKKANATILDL